MDEFLKNKLIQLSNKYEIFSFCDNDPAQFLRWYPKEQKTDIEIAAFIASMLSFGNRKQFIPKIRNILTIADTASGSISKWIIEGYVGFPRDTKKYYRFYSNLDLCNLFCELRNILNSRDRLLGDTLKNKYLLNIQENCEKTLDELVSELFPNSIIVPKGKQSAKKRINMFLRWMIRTDSPVDLGIWDWYPKEKLIIPLDVHVVQEAKKIGLLDENASPTKKTAVQLTKIMKEVFPKDPCKGDFALFGLGVDKSKQF